MRRMFVYDTKSKIFPSPWGNRDPYLPSVPKSRCPKQDLCMFSRFCTAQLRSRQTATQLYVIIGTQQEATNVLHSAKPKINTYWLLFRGTVTVQTCTDRGPISGVLEISGGPRHTPPRRGEEDSMRLSPNYFGNLLKTMVNW